MPVVESTEKKQYLMVDRCVILGGSAGSLEALLTVVEACTIDFKPPFVIVVHRAKQHYNALLDLLTARSKRPVVEVEHYDQLENGKTYLAPPNYHLLVGADLHLELDLSEKVLFSRPSIDVSFIAFANIFKEKLAAVVLSGANEDASKGSKEIINQGGVVIVQDPKDAKVKVMPQKTLHLNPEISNIVPANKIMKTILTITNQ